MTKKEQFDRLYLTMCFEVAKLSYCKRARVGAVLVTPNNFLTIGYNGTPSGMVNCCEDKNGATEWFVSHAEANAIDKFTKEGVGAKGATLYTTLSPCKDCCRRILGAGITRVVYAYNYKDTSGLDFLIENGVEVERFSLT